MATQRDIPFVQQAESVKALTEQAKALVGEILKVQRLTLEKAHRLGGILGKLRARCGWGEWLPTLFKLGVSRASAFEYIAIAKLPLTDVLSSGSIRDALGRNKIAGEEQEVAGQAVTDEAITEHKDDKTEGQESETSVRTTPTREPGEDDMGARIEAILCERCRRIGVPSCNRCRVKAYKIQNNLKLQPDKPRPPKRPPNGMPLYDWIEFNSTYAKLVRILSHINSKAPVKLLGEGEDVIHEFGDFWKRVVAWAEKATGQKVPQPW
jgi:hypothetical protein